jgi:8-oxo-dGTP pyrophosphatase MutT (NUDIX family)
MTNTVHPNSTLRHFTASAVVLDMDKRLVLLINHRAQGGYQFPGGHVDLGETADEAATREVFEETAVHATIWHPHPMKMPFGTLRPTPLAVVVSPAPPKPHRGEPTHEHIDHVYIATADYRPADPQLVEVAAAHWFSIDDLDVERFRIRPDVPILILAAVTLLNAGRPIPHELPLISPLALQTPDQPTRTQTRAERFQHDGSLRDQVIRVLNEHARIADSHDIVLLTNFVKDVLDLDNVETLTAGNYVAAWKNTHR